MELYPTGATAPQSRRPGPPNGIRTRATAVKGRRPRPLDDGGLHARSLRAGHSIRRPCADDRVGGSAEVALDGALGPRLRLAGILAELASSLALPQEVPALVELDLHAPQPRVLVVGTDVARRQLLAQRSLEVDELTDPVSDLHVLGHAHTVPPDRPAGRSWFRRPAGAPVLCARASHSGE